MLTIKVSAQNVLDKLSDAEQRQIPFAVATALNRTAEEIQTAVRDSIGQSFTIRSPWVLRNVRIRNADRATKQQSSATIEITPDSVLAKFERGGVKTARDGGSIATPQLATRNKRDIIPQFARPKAFRLANAGSPDDGLIAKGVAKSFLVRAASGRQLLLQRVGRRSKFAGKGTGADPNLKLLWVMVKSTAIPAQLKFYETGARVAGQRFVTNLKGMLAYALRSAK